MTAKSILCNNAYMLVRALFLIILLSNNVVAKEINLAVAANFVTTINKLKIQFEYQTKIHVIISNSSTGKLYAQIINGAPFDLFLAADQETPTKLVHQGLAVPNTQMTYAIGKLVLWAPNKNISDCGDKILQKTLTNKIAIANPKLAPFGFAAKQCLLNLEIYHHLQQKLIIGDSINQAFSFIATGNVEYGFVALSQILHAYKGNLDNSIWIVPQELYSPIIQQAILLNHAHNQKYALKFLEYLGSKTAQEIILNSGYGIT